MAASGHPSLIDAKEAEAISIPFCILASKDEDANDVKAFADNLKGPKHSETYSEMPHGWMAARYVEPLQSVPFCVAKQRSWSMKSPYLVYKVTRTLKGIIKERLNRKGLMIPPCV